eukprot:scaffold46760_cov298-Amphora_coffeaeformis.AAC.1
MAEFVAATDPINALAKATPGFVWSLDHPLQTNNDDLLSVVPRLRDDPLLMPQLSLWDNPQAVQHFAFKSGHFMYLKRKREWFTPPTSRPWSVCWWFWCGSCGLGDRDGDRDGDVTKNETNNDSYDARQQAATIILPRTPTLYEAFARLDMLQQNNGKPTAKAFDLASAKDFPKPTARKCECQSKKKRSLQ